MKSLCPKVVPPVGWVAETREGTLRRDAAGAADGGLLARLDAVVRFLMERDSLPCSEVVKTICDALEVDGGQTLYMVQQQGLAVAVTDRTCFDAVGVDRNSGRAKRAGRTGAIEAMRHYWSSEPVCSVYEAAGLDCLAVPLLDACKAWGYGKVQTGALQVTPPEGWAVHSSFGVLKTSRGQCLVRLEDVHAFLMQRDGIPSASAAAEVFSAFISDAGSALGMQHGAAKVRACLHITDQATYSESVDSFVGRLFMARVAEQVPYLPHHRFDRGTVKAVIYAIGVIAGEVWAPHAKDVELADRLDGYCPEGSLPSVATVREIAGRFAVPFSVANELWGWGHAVVASATPNAVTETSIPAPSAVSRPKTAQELEMLLTDSAYTAQVSVRKGGKAMLLTPKKWTFDLRHVVRGRMDVLIGEGMEISKAGEWVGACLGVSRSAIVQQMSRLEIEVAEREKQRLQELSRKNNAFGVKA